MDDDTIFDKLTDLWFVFGNDGEKSTYGNHKFIQTIFEHREVDKLTFKEIDISKLKKIYKPTKDCFEAVSTLIVN